jgi:hypothetical protein
VADNETAEDRMTLTHFLGACLVSAAMWTVFILLALRLW